MKKFQLFLAIPCLGILHPASASEIALSAALQPSTLQFVDRIDTAHGMRSSSNLVHLGVHWAAGRFYSGLALYSANYSYLKSPQQPGRLTTTGTQGATIGYGGADIVAGYALFDHVSFFLDIKNNTYTWKNDGYRLAVNGLGAGAQAHYPLGGGWILTGSFGIARLRASAEKQIFGNGGGYGFDLGVVHAIGSHSLLNVALKGYTDTLSFGDKLTQTHALTGLQLGYQFHF